jgi:hypothetical protein
MIVRCVHILVPLLFLASCSKETNSRTYSDLIPVSENDYLLRIQMGDFYEYGMPCGYIDLKGDTIIPIGKYKYCFTDTFKTVALVVERSFSLREIVGVNRNEKVMFDVLFFDNGPDYIEEGLFRILRNKKIGYANTNGKIIIEPQFECASPFRNGKAEVTYQCSIKKMGTPDDQHSYTSSNSWFFIDKNGRKIDSTQISD